MDLIDLESGTVHAIEGLSLPMVIDRDGDGIQDDCYRFLAAVPAPAGDGVPNPP